MQTITGKVISTKMNQTVVIQVDTHVAHPKYSKRMRRTTKYHAHVTIPVSTGDVVKIVQVAPISKTKTWQVTEVISHPDGQKA